MNEFKPLYDDKDKNDFHCWDVKAPPPEPVPLVDEQLELAKECERLKEEAVNKGYQEGLAKAEAELNDMRAHLKEWLQIIKNPALLIDDALSDQLIQTLFWLCESCIHLELSLNPEKIKSLIHELKDEIPAIQGEKKLLLNPLDAEFLKSNLSQSKDKELLHLISEDEALNRGDFYLRGEFSDIDGRLQTRLNELLKDYFTKEKEDK